MPVDVIGCSRLMGDDEAGTARMVARTFRHGAWRRTFGSATFKLMSRLCMQTLATRQPRRCSKDYGIDSRKPWRAE
jgi:hypothetical protein